VAERGSATNLDGFRIAGLRNPAGEQAKQGPVATIQLRKAGKL
jgi:hypothetical protein